MSLTRRLLPLLATLLVAACASGAPPATQTVTVNGTPSAATASTSATTQPATTSSPPASLQQAFQKVSPTVIRFETGTCDGYGSGSGFLVAPNLVVTAAHVVEGARLMRMVRGTTASAGSVVGSDRAQDVALVRTTATMGSSVATFATAKPSVGDPVATVGFSLGGQLAFHTGTVNGLDRKVTIDGRTASGLLEHDAAALPGDSGAPLFDVSGSVVGIHDAGMLRVEGQRLAVSATVAAPLVAGWRAAEHTQSPPAACSGVLGFDGSELDRASFPQLNATALHTLWVYAEAMNRGDYAAAAAQFVSPPPPEALGSGAANSQLSQLQVRGASTTSGNPVIWMSFESTQPAGKGPAERPQETCTRWEQDYRFGQRNGLWLISKTAQHGSTPRSQPCAG